MRSTLNLTPASLALLTLLASTSTSSATPVQPRAALTVYTYMFPSSVAYTPSTTATSCPNSTITATTDCPSGCTAAPIAGAVGVATDSWTCMTKPAETSWTSVTATSTCDAGSAVTTYTLWGGQEQEGCRVTTA